MSEFKVTEEILTAYALGELTGKELSQVEEYLNANPEAKNTVEEIRSLSQVLNSELQGEKLERLKASERYEIRKKIQEDAQGGFVQQVVASISRITKSMAIPTAVGAVAMVLIAVFVLPNMVQQQTGVETFEKEVPMDIAAEADAIAPQANEPNLAPATAKPSGPPPMAAAKKEQARKNIGTKLAQEGLGGKGRSDLGGASGVGRKTKDNEAFRGLRAKSKKQKVSRKRLERRQMGLSNQGVVLGQLSEEVASPAEQALADSAPGTGDDFDTVMSEAEEATDEKLQEDKKHDRGFFKTESYDRIVENDFKAVADQPLSTFSIDVDTASYSNVRRMLKQGQKPPAGAVRIEEFINYFPYDYAPPKGNEAFAVHVEVAQAPWKTQNQLVKVGLKGKVLSAKNRPNSNLVFLIDVSGSMNAPNKLPLLRHAYNLMVQQLGSKDRVSIVVYAGASGVVLPSTPGDKKAVIRNALNRLKAGGSTNGGAGVNLAYKIAQENFIKGGINRVILATDGDFNIGTTDRSSLIRLIEEKAKSGVFLTVLGFGMGNYKDGTLEQLANRGNGNYGYIDTQAEAQKMLVEELGSTLVTIAKDVKIQIEFNPSQVASYRLIGYENRLLNKEDFNDDTKDAGEIGMGHTVTALYEVVPKGAAHVKVKVDNLKYQTKSAPTKAAQSSEMMTIKLRHKKPDGHKSQLQTVTVSASDRTFAKSSRDFKFAAAVASFGMQLRGSKYKGSATFNTVIQWAEMGKRRSNGVDPYRKEFIDLVQMAKRIYP